MIHWILCAAMLAAFFVGLFFGNIAGQASFAEGCDLSGAYTLDSVILKPNVYECKRGTQ